MEYRLLGESLPSDVGALEWGGGEPGGQHGALRGGLPVAVSGGDAALALRGAERDGVGVADVVRVAVGRSVAAVVGRNGGGDARLRAELGRVPVGLRCVQLLVADGVDVGAGG